jgi:hypothetical protein
VLIPHIPVGITKLQQNFPIRFGEKRIYLRTRGTGPMTSVLFNGRKWSKRDRTTIHLPYDKLSDVTYVDVVFGNDQVNDDPCPMPRLQRYSGSDPFRTASNALIHRETRILDFCKHMDDAGFHTRYERIHAALCRDAIDVVFERMNMVARGEIKKLPEASQKAADKSYVDAANRLFDGLDELIKKYRSSDDATRKQIAELWFK